MNAAVHHLHEALGNGHAQPRTSKLVLTAAVLLGEGLEDLRDIFLLHTDACIADAET